MRLSRFVLPILTAGALFAAGSVALADQTSSTTTTTATSTTPAGSTSTTTTTTTPSSATTTTASSDGSQIVCHDQGPPTGSRLGGHRVCKSQHDWDAERLQEEQTVREREQIYGNPGGH